MSEIFHSVTLDKDKCKGCTNCIKRCPTQAIRVRNGKAKIIKERCIDCGECIRVCPYHAKKAVTDEFSILKNYKYNIALPAPSFYGQFAKNDDINVLLGALKKIGFDDVFEVAYAAQIVTQETRKILAEGKIQKPVINSACPTVVKLICARFPSLIDHILPVISPMNLAARLSRSIVKEKLGFTDEEIGVFFITPCAAKATCAKIPIGAAKTYINGTFSVKDTYRKVLPYMNEVDGTENLARADFDGVCWAVSGGEAKGLAIENYIAVDGIHNVEEVMEAIEDDKLNDIDFVEALACVGGCVGGPLNVENNFVAKSRIKKMADKTTKKAELPVDVDVAWDTPLRPNTVMSLDEDIVVAMQKMEMMNEIYERLPHLDCGSCGSPSCKTLSEDIVRGFAKETNCIFKLREKIADLTREMLDIERQ
ncbi:MAG: 4Fe-4S dicluster domain-containing protein [Ruminococcaceae bacterium]|nr:4Fe-4S dicluster domain-containing protein [Oscillospiraceae bacterium]